MREFIGPIVAGVLVTALLLVWTPSSILPERPPVTAEVETPYILMPRAVNDDGATLLMFGDGGRHPLGGPLDVHAGIVANGHFAWSGVDWACLRATEPCQPTGNETQRSPIPLAPAEPEDNGTVMGDSVVRITFLMFTTDGRLIASNAPRSMWDNLTLHGDFSPLSTQWWYLGEGKAPAGSVQVPALRSDVRDVMVGAPVGGVRTSVLESHRYDDYVDELWITARIEAMR